jgi:glycosyltransferase involved in cell wall biosynthesis
MKYSLVVPAYNESHRIKNLIGGLDKFDGEIIVVCDGSTDDTVDILEEIISTKPQLDLKYIWSPARLGKGGAVSAGFESARYNYVGFVDADGSVSIKQVTDLVDFLSTIKYDGIIGSRWMCKQTDQSIIRKLLSRSLNQITRRLFGLNFNDTQCGAKAFRKGAIFSVLPLHSSGFEFDVEILYRLKQNGYDVLEFPIEWKNDPYSKVRIMDSFRMFFALLRLWGKFNQYQNKRNKEVVTR